MELNNDDGHCEPIDARWHDPPLQSLIRQIDRLSLDRRSSALPKKILLRYAHDRTGPWVAALQAPNDGGRKLTVLSTCLLTIGETIIVETLAHRAQPGDLKLCIVLDCRPGLRAGLHEAPIFVSYLNCTELNTREIG